MEELRGSTGPLEGPIRLTATNDFGRNRLLDLLEEFKRLHPGVQLELFLSDDVVDLVEVGYDLGIRTGPLKDSRHHSRLLVRGTRAICAAPAYWDRAGRPRRPRDLSEHNCLLLLRRGASPYHWRHKGGAVRVSGDRVSNDGEVLRAWALRGVGVVLKSRWDVQDALEDGRLEEVLQDHMTDAINLYAVYPSGHRQPRRVKALIEHLSEQLSNAPQAN